MKRFASPLRVTALLVLAALPLRAAADPAPTSDYDLLQDRRTAPLGPKNWLGNLKWIAQEQDDRLSLVFRTMPKDTAAGEFIVEDQIVGSDGKVNRFPSARRTFFQLGLPAGEKIEECVYRPDAIEARTSAGAFSVVMPLERFGVLVQSAGSSLIIDAAAQLGCHFVAPTDLKVEEEKGRMVWTDGPYTLVFRHDGRLERDAAGRFVFHREGERGLRLAVSFHIDRAAAITEADALFDHGEDLRAESRAQWESYLASCPVTPFPEGYAYEDAFLKKRVTFSAEELRRRQLWHWQVLLANVYDIAFNALPVVITPDKSTWYGTWSNDGPESLRALARTNRAALARACMVHYVTHSINAGGELSWYLHGTGVAGLHNPHDLGSMSHGVPAIVTAVGDYVAATGDAGILDAAAGEGGTVWEKLRNYMTRVFSQRDVDGDGLVDWANLWEGGADDKVSPFFSRADLGLWMRAVVERNDAGLKDFYKANSRPVVNLYEQAYFLGALQSLEALAKTAGDAKTETFAHEKFVQIADLLRTRHWEEVDGFYYDWDVTAKSLVRSKNQDAFYLLRYLPDPARAARLVTHLKNPTEFALRYTPTLAANDKGFKADGYWCGGYWPREAAFLAWGLAEAGYRDEAVELCVKALCSGEGKEVLENVNPITGKPSTKIRNMAFGALLNVALSDVSRRD